MGKEIELLFAQDGTVQNDGVSPIMNPQLSLDGNVLMIGYELNSGIPENSVIELYKVYFREMVLLNSLNLDYFQTLIPDRDYTQVFSVSASSYFDKFLVVLYDSTNELMLIVLLAYDKVNNIFSVINQVEISQPITNVTSYSFTTMGRSNFTYDSKYFVWAYNSQMDTATGSETLLVQVYSADVDMELVAQLSLNGITNGATFFELVECDKNYIIVSTAVLSDSESPLGPAYLNILEFQEKCHKLKLKSSVQLPQFSNQQSVSYDGTVIATTGPLAYVSGPTIEVNASTSLSTKSKDDDNLRIYKFNGKKLCLAYKESFDGSISGQFDPYKEYFFQTQPTVIARRFIHKCDKIDLQNQKRFLPNGNSTVQSALTTISGKNGKILVTTYTDPNPNIENFMIAVYQIIET